MTAPDVESGRSTACSLRRDEKLPEPDSDCRRGAVHAPAIGRRMNARLLRKGVRMQCPRCRHENSRASRFCSECGARLASSCRECGAELPAGAKFCSQCGNVAGEPVAAPGRFGSPETYTPRHIAQKILTSKTALEGERKLVTVLFADLKGSMELLAERDPEEARTILDPVLERMMEAVHRYEGTVNQVMGDGIMALFGAPVAHEDHAVRACYAALRMQAAIKSFAVELQKAEGVPIQIRVGVNSGEVVVRSIGSDLNMDYTAVGQTTHLAARMEQMAIPGSVLITADTLKLGEGYIEVKSLGSVRPKGMAEPVEVYELTGATTVRRRLDAARVRGLTPFVGRSAEFDQLRTHQEHVAQGRGRVVAVVGEAGVGKSRLYYEFIRSLRMRDWLVIESGSASYGKATAYLPIIDLLRAYFQIETGEEPRSIREKVTGKLLALDRALEPALPAILALLDAPLDDPRWRDLDPAQRRKSTVGALKHVLLRESRIQPLCLVFEDLHWIDSETQGVLDSLVGSLPASRVLLLANYRPEYGHGWGAKTYFTQLRLDALPPESAEDLLHALLGSDPQLQALKALLIARTEGNPFFLEESVRTLVETQVLTGEKGGYRLGKPVDSIRVPATVQAVLAARIDRLSADDKHVLQFASVIGESVSYALLQAVADLPEEALHLSLGRLQAVEFLYQTGLFPDVEYTFRHALTYQVAYEGLLQERRRALHAWIVETIEALEAGRHEDVERLAFHAYRGAVWDKALRYMHQAGAKALARSASREALAFFEQALEAEAKLPETRETLTERLDVLLKQGTTLIILKGGHVPEVETCFASAQELCETLADESRIFPAVWGRWGAAYFSGRNRDAGVLAERLLTLGRASGDSMRLLEGHHCRWSTSMAAGSVVESCADADFGIEIYDPKVHHAPGILYGGHDPGACARFVSAWALWDLGYPEQALRRIKDAERVSRELSHSNTVAATSAFGVFLHEFRGESDLAFENSQNFEEFVRSQDLGQWVGLAKFLNGCHMVRRGRVADGLANAIGTLPVLRAWRYVAAIPLLLEACAHAGELSKGIEIAADGIATAARDDLGFHLSEIYRLRGELIVRESEAARPQAIADVRQAVAIAQSQQAKLLELRATASLARMLKDPAQKDEARGALATCYDWFTEGFDTADMKAARALLDDPGSG